MDFADQAAGNRQRLQAFQAVVHGGHIVDDLIRVPCAIGRTKVSLSGQDVLQGALRAFDPAGEDGLLARVHGREDMGIGQRLDRAIQPAQGLIGLGEQSLKLAFETNRRLGRKRCRHKRAIALRLDHVLTGPLGVVCLDLFGR